MIRTSLCILVAFTAEMFAANIAVTDDASLRKALRDAGPGDVVQVAPGNYRGGLYIGLKGSKEAPIVIEGTDAKDPPLIDGKGQGNCIQMSKSQYVTLRRLKLREASGNGINIDDGGQMDYSAHHITLDAIEVEDIGPKGNTDGIKMSGIKDFVLRDCRVEGWGGNAIDFVGCADGLIDRCTIRGKNGYSQATGPQAKGGSIRITIRNSFFDHAGGRAVNAGGSTGMQYFRPRDATYEAKDLTIENNVFVGSDAPVAFVGVDGAVFRNNTIINPTRWVMRILQETTDERFNRCRNVTFERNLIVYERAAVRSVVNIGANTSPETFTFRENWWWCSDSPGERPSLPARETDGVYGKDPQVKVNGMRAVAGNPAAKNFGAQVEAK